MDYQVVWTVILWGGGDRDKVIQWDPRGRIEAMGMQTGLGTSNSPPGSKCHEAAPNCTFTVEFQCWQSDFDTPRL